MTSGADASTIRAFGTVHDRDDFDLVIAEHDLCDRVRAAEHSGLAHAFRLHREWATPRRLFDAAHGLA
jgi:hypothetical protein